MAGVKCPGPSMERRRDTLQEDLGSLCCVFPVAHGACEGCSFSSRKPRHPNSGSYTGKLESGQTIGHRHTWPQAGSSVRLGGQLINIKKTVLCNNCKRWTAGRWTTKNYNALVHLESLLTVSYQYNTKKKARFFSNSRQVRLAWYQCSFTGPKCEYIHSSAMHNGDSLLFVTQFS